MDFFNLGDFLTLGIVTAAFLLFRYLDRNNRNILLARKYGAEIKDEIKNEVTSFTEDRITAIRNYGIVLEGDFKRAEAFRRKFETQIDSLDRNLTTVDDLNGRIKKYETVLRELDSWTEKAEENLQRIGLESAYIENIAEKIDVSKLKLDEIDKSIEGLQNRIKTETEQSIKETSESALRSVQTVISDLKNTAEEIERNVAEHHEAIKQAEVERKQNIENDMAVVNSALQKVISTAVEHSNEIEAGLIRDLNEAAGKRQAELRQLLIDRTTETEHFVDDRINEIKKKLQSVTELMENENANILEEQRKYKEEWQKSVLELDTAAVDQRDLWNRIIDENDAAISQYRRVQEARIEALENMADDAGKLDSELRLHIENVRHKAEDSFAAFETEMNQNYVSAIEGFNRAIGGIQGKIDSLEKEIGALKNDAYEKVSDNMKEFERLIESNLEKRSENINNQINEWRGALGRRFDELTENTAAECRRIEHECSEILRQKKNELDAGFDEEVRRIKDAFDDIGKNISVQTERYEKSVKALENQLQTSLEDTRKIVDTTLKTEISRFELINAEKLKKHERGIDEALRGQALVVEERLNEITALAGKSYSEIEAYKASCTEHFAEFDAAVEGIRKRGKELSAENEERLASVRAKIEETAVEITTRRTEMFGAISEGVKSLENAINTAEKRIDDFFSKTELIDKTIAVKKDIENELEDLNADMEKLALRSIEISELKNQFEKIKRMEEDINNKMSEFNIEQQRIERMEINFNRLLQTSQSVEERLKHISDSDDMLQEAQIKLRKLGEIIGEAEEKYQRIEKKNLILETTSDGIDKNFGLLQDSEAAVQKLGGDIQRITVGLDDIRTAITKLAEENEKAHDTIEKLSTLDKTMNDLDVRIGDMQKARAWLADLETRLNEKYREAQQLVKLSGDIIKGEKISADMENSLSSEIRDNVIRLKKLGWSVDDIVKALKVSRSAVELILEMAPREK